MFDLEHHQKILLILESLDASIFDEAGAAFGGGTLITLLNGEYRWSKDVDFICPVGPGYRRLREIVANAYHKPSVFFAKTERLDFPRELKADQYGVRFLVLVDGSPIKFEIVAEARIKLEPFSYYPWASIPCLSFDDQCTEKLLANADRWLDPSIESRDIIDLAMLRQKSIISQEAYDKAENAYPTLEPLKKAIKNFQTKADYREKCFQALQVKSRSRVVDGIDLLATDFGMEKTEREISEERN
jgi:predicted nucleotidyltransferase component of viral defense system